MLRPLCWLLLAALLLAGCANEVHDQPKLTRPFEESPSFGQAARELRPHTVARGELREDAVFFEGMEGGEPVEEIPVELSRAVVEQGQAQYDIFCAPCHGLLGDGQGVIVQRGFPAPPSFHSERLREAPAGHYFQVITHGQGAMYSYAARVAPAERWAIIAYIRALQLSQDAPLERLAPEEQQTLP